jgi:hypothetical protein
MAKRFTLEILMDLAKAIGANPNKFMGTRSNITFLGKGPTKNPLFQQNLDFIGPEGRRVISPTSIAEAAEALGDKGKLISAVEDAMAFASAGKLNPIQTEMLGNNFVGIKNILHPPPLPMATISKFPKQGSGITSTQPYKSMLPEPGPGDAKFVKDAMAMETGMSRAIARQILQQDTRLKLKPEELFMLKEGKGEPLELMRKYYGESMLKYDDFLNQVNFDAASPTEFAEMVLKYVKLTPQFAEGGLAEILQAPRSGMRIGGLGLLTRGLRTALKRTKKGYDVPGADFQVLMDDASYLMSPVNMQKIKKLELYRKQLVRDILRKESGGKFMHGPQPEATRADLQLLDDYIAQLKNKIKEVGYYGQGAAEEKSLLASRPDLPFSKFVKDKSRHAHGGLAGILEV